MDVLNNTSMIHPQQATAILQGRMGSTRLPGKVMLPLAGEPAMVRVYQRLLHCRRLERVLVATSDLPEDDPIADLFHSLGVTVFRGSASDPLDRYHQAGLAHGVRHGVRVMADCPLVDPALVDGVVEGYFSGDWDLCHLEGEFPTGLDVSTFSMTALARCWREATRPSAREHITAHMIHHPDRFRIKGICPFHGLGHHRWVMDHPEDYVFIRALYDALYRPDAPPFASAEILHHLDAHPELMKINGHIQRDQGYLRAVAAEGHTP